MGMRQRLLQLCQRDIEILMDKFDQKTVEGGQSAATRFARVRRGSKAGSLPDLQHQRDLLSISAEAQR